MGVPPRRNDQAAQFSVRRIRSQLDSDNDQPMRVVIQRVLNASVAVDGETISSIGRGLLCLVGIAQHDTHDDLKYISEKILALRVWPDESDAHWKRSVQDIEGELLCVSQFTLLAATRKGAKPDFHAAMTAQYSREMYSAFLERLGQLYRPDRIKDGRFGAMMKVDLTNEGPVTLIVDSHDSRTTTQAREPSDEANKAAAKAARRAETEARTAKNREAKENAAIKS